MPELNIDPTTRIEGHHGITLQVDSDGTVTEAKSHMEMFRGAEIVTLGRPPSDAPQITGMVCGVCFLCHRLCSSKAAEDAAMNADDVDFGGPPDNAVLLRDAVEGIFYLWNHAVHLFALVGPDYSDAVAGTGFDRLDPLEGDGYMGAMENQRKVMKALAQFGGRAPHPVSYVPGGMATRPDQSTIESVKSRVLEVSNWLGPTSAVPEVLENVQNGEFDPSLGEGLHDIVSILVAAAQAGAADIGEGPGRFYSNGIFEQPDSGDLFLKRGVYRNGSVEELTKEEVVAGITEDTDYTWFTDESGGAPTEAQPPEPAPDKEGAYSWGKAPRFEGDSMEVGPLARMVISDLDPFDLRATLGGGAAESNTLNRLIARAQEALVVRDQVVEWLNAIDPSEPFMADDWTDDFTGKGVGLFEPSRGTLSHYMDVENGEIERYQIVTPTIWNLGPRDGDDQPSPLEEGVVGDVVEDMDNPINVLRTIRSMDPCLACAVHVQSPTEEFETEVEPVAPEIGGGGVMSEKRADGGTAEEVVEGREASEGWLTRLWLTVAARYERFQYLDTSDKEDIDIHGYGTIISHWALLIFMITTTLTGLSKWLGVYGPLDIGIWGGYNPAFLTHVWTGVFLAVFAFILYPFYAFIVDKKQVLITRQQLREQIVI